ncbi:MAG TPA: hypothetical protein VLS89_18255, partial [Candidatus Nanopelagicales bacterium]|nr:hypothetical protein [Candidatus Nanopelagicales bacterium]
MRKMIFKNRLFGPAILGAALLAGGAEGCLGGDEEAASCSDDLAYFEANVWEPILSKKCVICHSEGGLAQNTRLVLQQGSDAASVEANFELVKE